MAALTGGCKEDAAPEGEGPKKPSAPIPTTPENRRPLRPAEVQRLEAIARGQIEAVSGELKAKCWDPISDAGLPDTEAARRSRRGKLDAKTVKELPSLTAKVTVQLVFDEEGKEVSREILEDPMESRPGLGKCVGDNLPPVTIPASKRKVIVKVPVKFP